MQAWESSDHPQSTELTREYYNNIGNNNNNHSKSTRIEPPRTPGAQRTSPPQNKGKKEKGRIFHISPPQIERSPGSRDFNKKGKKKKKPYESSPGLEGYHQDRKKKKERTPNNGYPQHSPAKQIWCSAGFGVVPSVPADLEIKEQQRFSSRSRFPFKCLGYRNQSGSHSPGWSLDWPAQLTT